jgi:hypothetical protein
MEFRTFHSSQTTCSACDTQKFVQFAQNNEKHHSRKLYLQLYCKIICNSKASQVERSSWNNVLFWILLRKFME